VGSATNAAFERYYRIEEDEVREVFSQASAENPVRTEKRVLEIGKLLNSL